jgi:hypothetical protein
MSIHTTPVANRQVKGKQQTVTWHVDDLKSSHVDPGVNDKFYEWLETTYGSEELGHVALHCTMRWGQGGGYASHYVRGVRVCGISFFLYLSLLVYAFFCDTPLPCASFAVSFFSRVIFLTK